MILKKIPFAFSLTIKSSFSALFTVPGEVLNPGHFPYSRDKPAVFDTIGLAGMTGYGNRGQMILVRNENGENKLLSVNLTR
jgi:protein involved in polysaccharide export with SLBB domain